uniref:Myb/SANT-like domain-containing protein n=1 Tax=Ananas comosus var. bracteatus TaxID=296719 RepID=A0A6V7QVV1_ANACO
MWKKKGTSGDKSDYKVKATWERNVVYIFCDLCIQEIELGNKPGTHFNKIGWNRLVSNFNKDTGKEYDRMQLKNKWDQLKKDWKQWKQLRKNEMGFEWNQRKRTIDASDEWWQNKLKDFPDAAKFRFQGIEPELEQKLDRMFMSMDPIGEDDVTLALPAIPIGVSMGVTPLVGDNTKDSHPNAPMENLDDISDEIDNFRGTTTLEPAVSRHIKRAIEQGTSQLKEKKQAVEVGEAVNMPAQIDRLRDGIESRSTATSLMKSSSGYSITEGIRLLDSIEEIPKASALYYFATKIILDKDKRELFMALAPDAKVWWLKMEQEERNK